MQGQLIESQYRRQVMGRTFSTSKLLTPGCKSFADMCLVESANTFKPENALARAGACSLSVRQRLGSIERHICSRIALQKAGEGLVRERGRAAPMGAEGKNNTNFQTDRWATREINLAVEADVEARWA